MKEKMQTIINKWNPLDIYPLIEGEYSYEINRIVEEVQNSGINSEELGEIINRIFSDTFSNKFDKSIEDCTKIAQKILSN